MFRLFSSIAFNREPLISCRVLCCSFGQLQPCPENVRDRAYPPLVLWMKKKHAMRWSLKKQLKDLALNSLCKGLRWKLCVFFRDCLLKMDCIVWTSRPLLLSNAFCDFEKTIRIYLPFELHPQARREWNAACKRWAQETHGDPKARQKKFEGHWKPYLPPEIACREIPCILATVLLQRQRKLRKDLRIIEENLERLTTEEEEDNENEEKDEEIIKKEDEEADEEKKIKKEDERL